MTEDDIIAAELAAGRLAAEDVRDAEQLAPAVAAMSAGEQHGGQVRMAYRLAAAYSGRLLHVHGIGWHTWDGARWARDEGSAHAMQAVLDVLRAALTESLGDKQLRADVGRCETATGVRGVLDLAASMAPFSATLETMDAHPHLLNVANGVLDLETLDLRPHDPALRLTKITRGAYDPDADQHEWRTFLARVLPDPDVRAYLQRLFGHALLGEVREHIFPIATGTGGNGKGVTSETVLHALGSYAAPLDPDLLIAGTGGNADPKVLGLKGLRLAIGSETNEGRAIDEALMKRLTGGDTLIVRPLYSNALVEWEPTHSLIYVTNHLPTVSGSSDAAWRRIRVVPFDVTIPEDERDGTLTARLRDSADAVLTWLVDGWREYATAGMQTPDAVRRRTDTYQHDHDDVARFVSEACIVNPYMTAKSSDLYGEWTRWALEDGAHPISQKVFGAELDRLGYPAKKTRGVMLRPGIGIAA